MPVVREPGGQNGIKIKANQGFNLCTQSDDCSISIWNDPQVCSANNDTWKGTIMMYDEADTTIDLGRHTKESIMEYLFGIENVCKILLDNLRKYDEPKDDELK